MVTVTIVVGLDGGHILLTVANSLTGAFVRPLMLWEAGRVHSAEADAVDSCFTLGGSFSLNL
jgi:hypothetical protein